MAWTKEQFVEFCRKAGVDPGKSLREGKVDLRPKAEQVAGNVKGSTLSNIKQGHLRKKCIRNAFGNNVRVQDTKREPDSEVALGQEVCGQEHGMDRASKPFRIHVIGYRVRPIDADNFAGGCKAIIDGVVAAGLLPGDDWKTLQITFSQKRVTAWSQEGTQLILDTP